MKKTLIIGYGNTLRSDDGVGVWIADHIASLGLPGVEVRTCQQLCMELADELIDFDNVIFIDAAVDGGIISYQRSFAPEASPSYDGHQVSPGVLQAIATDLYGANGEFHLFTVRGESFEFGCELSPSVHQRALDVSRAISTLIARSAVSSPAIDCILN